MSTAARELRRVDIFLVIINDDQFFNAHRHHFMGDLLGGQPAFIGLPAGHGNSIIEQDFIGDVHPGGQGRANGERAGMVVGAIAKILENMVA